MNELLAGIAERLMRCPAAPYHEGLVGDEILRICRHHGLATKVDSFGNILVQSGSPSKRKKNIIALAAHMDHPGFVIRRRIDSRTVTARFLGGVGDSYFQSGTKVVLMPGRIKAALGKRIGKSRDFELRSPRDLPRDVKFAVWDLPEFRSGSGLYHGRACDDLIGVATILTVLATLKGTAAAANVIGILSRAEEVGFQGALALAESRRLPRGTVIISLETSRELPGVKIGQGVIVRVGDRASIFDSAATRFITEVAGDLQKRDNNALFQRALMSGGTCEATAYQEYGYQSAAVCVALGNYHNCGANNKIRAEFVSEFDAQSMSRLLVECARKWPRYTQLVEKLLLRLERLAREGKRELQRRKIEFSPGNPTPNRP